MQIVFGIDFGTTNSALSIYQNGTVEVIAVEENDATGKLMRSVLYFSQEKEIYCGQAAIRHYVDEGATGRFMQSIKTFLPNASFVSTELIGKRYGIDDLVAIILRRLKAQGEAHVNGVVESVVLGRPVLFSADPVKDALAEERLKSAARKAGFKNIWFQYEPVAAALAFEESLRAGEERIVFIGDFGGGTSDFSVIRVQGGAFHRADRRQDVLALGGLTVAGDKFDGQLMWEKVAHYFGRYARYQSMGKKEWQEIPLSIIATLCQWHRIPLLRARKTRELIRVIKGTTDAPEAIGHLQKIIDDNFGFFLFQAIERAKCDLSGQEDAIIAFVEGDLLIREPVRRAEFEVINAANFQKIIDCIDAVLARSGLKPAAIDTVFLTGGTSRIPRIEEIFAERFGRDKLENRDAFTSVAHGLGTSVPLFL